MNRLIPKLWHLTLNAPNLLHVIIIGKISWWKSHHCDQISKTAYHLHYLARKNIQHSTTITQQILFTDKWFLPPIGSPRYLNRTLLTLLWSMWIGFGTQELVTWTPTSKFLWKLTFKLDTNRNNYGIASMALVLTQLFSPMIKISFVNCKRDTLNRWSTPTEIYKSNQLHLTHN